MTLSDMFVWAVAIYVGISIFRFLFSNATTSERQEKVDYDSDLDDQALSSIPRKDTIHIDVVLEQISGGWYGWAQDNGGEYFVGQGTTKQEAIKNCTERMAANNKTYCIKFFEK